MALFKGGGLGAGQRLSATGFLALGVLTFWVYSVLRFAAAWRAHCARRWREIEGRDDLKGADPQRMAALHARGFSPGRAAPGFAAGLFALSAALVAGWFVRWILLGEEFGYGAIVGAVGASSALFYAALLVAMLWALGAVRRHETSELLVREVGAGALLARRAELGDDIARRWERWTNHVVLFLVCAAPMVFSPTLGAHLFLTGVVWGHVLVLPALCFALAAVLHVWGTVLLVGLYNGHIEYESLHGAREALHPAADRLLPSVAEGAQDAAPERELAAIMLTDMQGYSKAMERDEARAYAKLVEHNRIMRGAIAAHRGREIKTIGDAFLVIFRSALDAVDCGLAAQRAFADYNLGKDEADRILVRIGIHLGDVLVTGNDVFGDGVNVAARIEPHAEPGGICISEPVFEMVRKKIQLEVTRLEGIRLKNIALAPELYRIRLST
ncbi:MAG: adenylate/guanylate cyclase domain-containing protein [Betaproteobacteria bacterium]|nr:adenylate/guanylate cyclase domain-containing protein [Betaproteobacteria bacterium]